MLKSKSFYLDLPPWFTGILKRILTKAPTLLLLCWIVIYLVDTLPRWLDIEKHNTLYIKIYMHVLYNHIIFSSLHCRNALFVQNLFYCYLYVYYLLVQIFNKVMNYTHYSEAIATNKTCSTIHWIHYVVTSDNYNMLSIIE